MKQYKCTGCGEARPCYTETNQEETQPFIHSEVESLKCILDETNQTSYNWKEVTPGEEQKAQEGPQIIQLETLTNKRLCELYTETQGFAETEFYVGQIRFELIEAMGSSRHTEDGEPVNKFTFESMHERRVKTWVI